MYLLPGFEIAKTQDARRKTHDARRTTQDARGQALFFVLFILTVFGALAGGLTVMWESEIRTRTSDRDGLIAFYLAQAGIERAKIEVLNNVNLSGNSIWYTDLDNPTDNYTFRYNFNVVILGAQRTLIGRGEVLDTGGGNALAHREINVTVAGIQDTDFPLDGTDNDPPNNTVAAWSWREQ